MIHSLPKVGNMIKCLKKRVHVTGSSLILETNITCHLFGVIVPIINNSSHSNLSFNNAFIIHNISFTRIIEIHQRHKRSETPITFSGMELVCCFFS
uniref:Uncharacterized protein n=1 Tax=Arundo donax TaxID=35708 RepID=A0A0A9D754_ARUDO